MLIKGFRFEGGANERLRFLYEKSKGKPITVIMMGHKLNLQVNDSEEAGKLQSIVPDPLDRTPKFNEEGNFEMEFLIDLETNETYKA